MITSERIQSSNLSFIYRRESAGLRNLLNANSILQYLWQNLGESQGEL